MILHGYWRSTAAWRVRLALQLKGIAHQTVTVNLVQGAQIGPAHLALNPQGLVPVLEHDGAALSQSLAIIEYLDELYPEPPLLPADPLGRARMRAAAQIIAADVHPLGNLRVQRWLRGELAADDAAVSRWLHHWMRDGLASLERFAERHGGDYLHGSTPGLADLCLVPQLYNARRFGLPLDDFARLAAIDARLSAQSWARAAHPDVQPDSQ
jgi:maleylacetoacetate isomerase